MLCARALAVLPEFVSISCGSLCRNAHHDHTEWVGSATSDKQPATLGLGRLAWPTAFGKWMRRCSSKMHKRIRTTLQRAWIVKAKLKVLDQVLALE